MSQFNRIRKLVEAQDLINQAVNLIKAAISGLSIEEQAMKNITNLLLRMISPARNIEILNIQDLFNFILFGDRRKIYVIIDESKKIAFSTKEEAENFIKEYSADGVWKVVEIEMK
jgi:hypothetical protein